MSTKIFLKKLKGPREKPTNSGANRRFIRRCISSVLNRRNVFGPFVLRETIELWASWTVTQSPGFGLAVTMITSGNSKNLKRLYCRHSRENGNPGF